MSYAKTIILGNVGRDAEFRYTPQGVAVCDFSVAVNKVSGKGEARKEKTTWYKVTIWRERAEALNQYITKGKKVLVEGTLEGRAYLDKNQQPQYSLELTCTEFAFADGPKDNGDSQPRQAEPASTNDAPEDNADIPF